MKGLENAASLMINDFALLLRDDKFQCSRFEAAFLSPRITAALLQDPTMEEYEIGVEAGSDEEFASDSVASLISLSRNGSLELTESNFASVKRIAKSLGNSELCEALWGFKIEGEDVSHLNVVDRLSLCDFLSVAGSRELDYLSSHFYEIDRAVLEQVSHADLRKVLESEHLRIDSEDALLDFLFELGTDYFDLLGCLQTEYLSRAGMSRLLETISREEVDESLWKSLCRRLLLFIPSYPLPESRFHVADFPFDSSHPFKGIVSHLSSECGGNVHTQGIVSITASSNMHNVCHQVADYNWTNYWNSCNEPNSWIQFDFKNRKISPTHYTVKSDGNGGYHLLKWALDGSNDGTSWTNLDRRETKDLDGDYIVKSYECGSIQGSRSFFRFVRLTQTGPNTSRRCDLQLANLEFFGEVMACQSP
jgi:hypothetical protein